MQVIRTLESSFVAETRVRMESFSLLAFEPGSEERHLPSALQRWFKDGRLGLPGDERAARAVESGLTEAIHRLARGRGITHVCRVLGSWETVPERDAPLETLAASVARCLGAEFVRPMRRTSAREPMSRHSYLSGRGALSRRIDYARQDLIWEGSFAGARFLVLDDIRCLGASESVWAAACIALGGAADAVAMNLGQTAGLAEDGETATDIGEIREAALASRGAPRAFFEQVWLSPQDRTVHSDPSCRAAADITVWWRGLLKPGCTPCPLCSPRRGLLLRRLFRGIRP